MGVEWEQGIFAADLTVVGTQEMLLDIDRVLRKYGAVDSADRIATFDIGGATCLLYTSPSPRDRQKSRMPSSA